MIFIYNPCYHLWPGIRINEFPFVFCRGGTQTLSIVRKTPKEQQGTSKNHDLSLDVSMQNNGKP